MPQILIKSDIKHQKRCYICPHHLLGALWPKNMSVRWEYMLSTWVHVERMLHQSGGGDHCVWMFWFVFGECDLIVAKLNWENISIRKLLWVFFFFLFFLVQNNSAGECVVFPNVYVSDAIMLVLVFQPRSREKGVWNQETDEVLCIFINSTFQRTFLIFYLFSHEGRSQVHILN